MRKFLLPAFSLMFCSGIATAAVGDTFTDGTFTYEVTGDATVAVTGVEKTVTEANIPESVTNEGTDYSVTSIGNGAFYWSNITSATIPNSVTTIERQGFYNCPLASVTIGTGLKSAGDYAFSYTNLTSVTFPEGTETIGGNCFFGCKNLTQVNFPSTLKEIGSSCFYKVPLTSAILPEGLVSLGKSAFLYCDKLTEVSLPQSLTEIADGTFFDCTSLTEITLPQALTSIGKEAFYNVPLTEIVLPATLESIGGSAFTGTNLTSYTVAEGSTSFTSIDNVLYSADKTLLISFPSKCATTELTLPAECLGISSGAFDKTGIQKVTVGSKFRAFDEFAFCQSALSEINFPESCVFIGEQAFAGTNLTNVVLPKHLPQLQEAAFAECKALNSVTFPSTLRYIDQRAFFNCTSLVTVNCEGVNPPALETWYEAYESPFYLIPSTATCNIPSGALAAYQDSDWNAVFANHFVESLAGVAVPTEISPADGENISSFDGLTLTFGEDVSVVRRNPAIKVIEGSLVAGVPVGTAVSVDDWMMIADSKTALRIFPADYDGYTSPFNMEAGKDYYVTVPAGILKNAAGEFNEEMTLHYKGAYLPPVVKLESVTPADGSDITEISTISMTFAESVVLQSSRLSDIRVVKGELVDGVPTGETIGVEKWWAVNGTTSGTAIAIFAGDEYDGFAMNIALENDADYYVVLPQGLFRLSSSYSTLSDEIILHYSNKNSGVEMIATDAADVPAEIYTIEGRHVTEMEKGRVYIIRRGNTVTKELCK